jgi:preprotein translocase subunit SecG
MGHCVTITGHQVTCCFDRETRSRVDSEDEMVLALQIGLIITSLLLILLVLLHRGRGGGLSSLFGGGMQSSLSGSSVAEKNLDRATLFIGAVWLICVVGLGLLIKVA